MYKRLLVIVVVTVTVTTLGVYVAWLLKPPTEADADLVFWEAHDMLVRAGSAEDLKESAKKFHKALACSGRRKSVG